MNLEVDVERVCLAHKAARAELLAERTADGHWLGQMSSSPLATAAAVSALVVAHAADSGDALRHGAAVHVETAGELLLQGELSELVVNSLHWLARCQNADGGWGDCDGARSNLAATLLVQAAFRLTGVPAKYADLIVRAEHYVDTQGGAATLRRWDGKEKALAAPILANAALAGMVPWRQVPALPFELICVPNRWQHWLHLPIIPQAVPALVAVGLTKFHHDPPHNPLTRIIRRALRAKSRAILERVQSVDGSFLDATPLTAFVVMSLASAGLQDSPVVERGVEFLLASVRPDASWSVYSNLATRNTALAVSCLCTGETPLVAATPPEAAWQETAHIGDATTHTLVADEATQVDATVSRDDHIDAAIDWLLGAQHWHTDPTAPAASGGWGWTNAPGAVANVDDTAAALLAIARGRQRDRIDRAARAGIDWLLAMQDEAGGWPAYGSGPNFVSCDRIGTDSTAHALEALAAWRRHWPAASLNRDSASKQATFSERITAAIKRGMTYLATQQREDGSFIPLGFGNEQQADEANPVLGTAQVLATCAELGDLDSPMARRAGNWLLMAQHAVGSWGPPRVPLDYSGTYRTGSRTWRENDVLAQSCTVEETAQAVAALLPLAPANKVYANAVSKGLTWLADAIEQDRHRHPAVLGWCFTRLWYHERLYPLIFAAGALSQAAGQLAPERPAVARVGEARSGY